MTKNKDRKNEPKDPLDLDTYCGRLGHFVPFRYCVTPAQDAPCFKILDCWWQIFDVKEYLSANLDESVFKSLVKERKPPDRIHTILHVLDDLKKQD